MQITHRDESAHNQITEFNFFKNDTYTENGYFHTTRGRGCDLSGIYIWLFDPIGNHSLRKSKKNVSKSYLYIYTYIRLSNNKKEMEIQSAVFVLGIGLTLSAMYQITVAQQQKFHPHLDIIAEIESEFDCEQLLGKTEEASEQTMLECNNIMNSELMQKTKEYMLKATMSEMEEARTNAFRKHPKMHARKRRSVTSCPVMNREYFEKHQKMDGLRSLSPYDDELTYNKDRFPKYILQNKCLCKGCINPSTGVETMEYLSQLIKAEARAFFINASTGLFTLGKEEIRVGCTCVRPVYI
ncbi:uncharacterized protein LOC120343003 [Styela clava]